MNQAQHIYNKFTSGALREPSLSKLCYLATAQHTPGKKIYLFPDGSKIISIGRGPLRQVKVIEPPSEAPQPEAVPEVLYAAQVTTINHAGHYTTQLLHTSRDKGLTLAAAKAIKWPNVTSVEIIQATITGRLKLWTIKPEDLWAKEPEALPEASPTKRVLTPHPALQEKQQET